MSSCTIDDLPDSILLRIFSFVALERVYTLFRLRYVCRKWKTLASDSDLWRRIVFPHKKFFTLNVFERLVSWCDNVIEVDVSFSLDSPEDIVWLDVIVDKCRNIRILNAENCPVNKEGLKKLSESCVQLREVVLTPCEDVFCCHFIDVIKNCPNLESLQIIKIHKPRTRLSSKIGLSRDDFFKLSDPFMKHLLSSGIKRFKCVYALFSSEGTFMTSDCPSTKLEELDLSISRTLTDKMITGIASKSPNLKTLNITGCSLITEQGILNIVTFCPLLESVGITATTFRAVDILTANCKNLHTLDLLSNDISDELLEVIGKRCPALRHLSVSRWSFVGGIYISYPNSNNPLSNEAICAIANGCPLLTVLDISSSEIHDTTLYVITEKLSRLKELHVSLPFGFASVGGINAIVKKCRTLEVLVLICPYSLDGFNLVSDSLTALCFKKQLNFSSCDFTDTLIENVTQACPNLEILDLGGCILRRFTDQALFTFAKNCPYLRRLDLHCRPIVLEYSMEGLAALSNSLSKLQYLHVTVKKKEVVKCATLFVKQCPFLNKLDIEFVVKKIKKREKKRQELRKTVLKFRSSCKIDFHYVLGKITIVHIEMTSMVP